MSKLAGTNLNDSQDSGPIGALGKGVAESGETGNGIFKDVLGGIISEPAGTDSPLRTNGPSLSRNA